VLLVQHLRSVDWSAMRVVLAHLPRESLFVAGVLTAASYAVYCSFDLLARRATSHPLDRGRVLSIGFVGHACALSLGPAGAGVRVRLYTRQGLPAHLAAALWLFNVATNWLGFTVLAGVALTTRWIALPTRCTCSRAARASTARSSCAGSNFACPPSASRCCSACCRRSTGCSWPASFTRCCASVHRSKRCSVR
jgi:hypothetical protein